MKGIPIVGISYLRSGILLHWWQSMAANYNSCRYQPTHLVRRLEKQCLLTHLFGTTRDNVIAVVWNVELQQLISFTMLPSVEVSLRMIVMGLMFS